jgi:hypothetical protein
MRGKAFGGADLVVELCCCDAAVDREREGGGLGEHDEVCRRERC